MTTLPDAVEGGFTSLGSFGFEGQVTTDPGTVQGTFKTDDWNAFVVGIAPLSEQFELFAKAGFGYWRTKLSASGTFSGSGAHGADASGTSGIAGLGGRYEFTPMWSLRVEWERFFKVGDEAVSGQSDLDLWSVGVQYRF
jgi:OmpA-OmpF porin, OOP family